MRRLTVLGLASLAALGAFSVAAEAQAQDRPLVFRVQPRSFLDPGNVVAPGSIGGSTVTMAYRQTFVDRPTSWWSSRDLYGEGVLPDPAGGPGPWVGAENPFPRFGVPDVEATGSIR